MFLMAHVARQLGAAIQGRKAYVDDVDYHLYGVLVNAIDFIPSRWFTIKGSFFIKCGIILLVKRGMV